MKDLALAFSTGLFSFFSPTILPVLLGFLPLILGIRLVYLLDSEPAQETPGLGTGFVFVLGFSFMSILLALPATRPGYVLWLFQDNIRQTGGVLIGLLGLILVWPRAWSGKMRLLSLAAWFGPWAWSFLAGLGVAAGWVPPLGRVFTSLVLLAGTAGNYKPGLVLLITYFLGFDVFFIIVCLVLSWTVIYLTEIIRAKSGLAKVTGWALLATGFLLWAGRLEVLTPRIKEIFPL